MIQITDCHLFADIQRCSYRDINPYITLRQVLVHVKALEPDRVIVTGDLSGDLSGLSYQHFASLWQQAEIPAALHILPGNHDQPSLLTQFFSHEMKWLQAPLRDNNWCLHALDSHYQGTLGHVSTAQLERLEQQVRAMPDASHLVAVHHHPIPCNSWMDKHQWCNRDAFVALLEALPQIRLVIHGHVHAELTFFQGQTQILACPSTCWQWRHTQEFAVDDQAPGLRLLELHSGGSFNTQIIRVSHQCNV
ncbi:metallophosphoesterase [Lacimicrobium alkaliphilum]|uniref:metallophosphoesterase n=1 Tax=Lacimicrobium alkaliphilum TaxID=1526571 RepID=UPI0015D4BF5D|nr:metallophosphoesterase [Lacimicrobium alkaliphilum]